MDKARKKAESWEEEKNKLEEQDQVKDDLIKQLNKKIEQLELTQKTYAGMIFKRAAKAATEVNVKYNFEKNTTIHHNFLRMAGVV